MKILVFMFTLCNSPNFVVVKNGDTVNVSPATPEVIEYVDMLRYADVEYGEIQLEHIHGKGQCL